MAENVAAAVDPRALAVPDAEDAVYLLFIGQRVENGRAENGGSGDLFIQAGTKVDVVFIEQLLLAHERQIIAAQRRTLITRDERARLEPGLAVAAHLIDRQTDQGLDASQVHDA